VTPPAAPLTDAPLLRVTNAETYYGDVIQALRGVSVDVETGSVVTILGANGAGKTTFLKTVMGLLDDQPEKGRIEFAGQDVTRWDAERLVRLGLAYVPEGREVFRELTVWENLQMGGYSRRDRQEIGPDLDRVVGYFPILAERRRQLAGTLSGGEQQMLAIGRALMARPRLLMLDEPSLGLAPRLVGHIFEIIRRINEGGTTILLVEQNARMALGVARAGYVLETGRVVFSGSAGELAANENVRELYLGVTSESVKGFKRYKKKRRWS
jgi:branched-chain amino acid transport system ATP-binding protein